MFREPIDACNRVLGKERRSTGCGGGRASALGLVLHFTVSYCPRLQWSKEEMANQSLERLLEVEGGCSEADEDGHVSQGRK